MGALYNGVSSWNARKSPENGGFGLAYTVASFGIVMQLDGVKQRQQFIDLAVKVLLETYHDTSR